MRILICGAGQVGFGIAERLSTENNDVSIVDQDPNLVRRMGDLLDVRGFVGSASHPDVLDQAGARDADMLIAVTHSDEVNMVACQVAHSLFDVPTKVARVRAQSYLEPHWSDLFLRHNMPIDVVISPEIEVGEMILRRLRMPGAFEVLGFCDNEILVLGISCEADCPVIDTPLKHLGELFPDLPAIVVGVYRDGKLFVPRSDDQLFAGDEAYVATLAPQTERVMKIFGHEERRAQRVIIAGGGNIGLFVARRLEQTQRDVRLKVLEHNRQRAVEIAEQLDRAIVLNGSALDEELLREAGVESADMIVALTNDDQVNILASVLGGRLGSARNMCLINNTGYMTIVRSLGIDAFINPRGVTVSRILQHVRRGRIRAVQTVLNGAGEVIDAEALPTSPLVGRALNELDLPDGIRIGGIRRGRTVMVPKADTTIEANDRIVIFATKDRVHEVEQLFRVSLDYF
jgi:trk system potassium uptake protein TrkA